MGPTDKTIVNRINTTTAWDKQSSAKMRHFRALTIAALPKEETTQIFARALVVSEAVPEQLSVGCWGAITCNRTQHDHTAGTPQPATDTCCRRQSSTDTNAGVTSAKSAVWRRRRVAGCGAKKTPSEPNRWTDNLSPSPRARSRGHHCARVDTVRERSAALNKCQPCTLSTARWRHVRCRNLRPHTCQ